MAHRWNKPLAIRHLPPSTEAYTHPAVDWLFRALYLSAVATVLCGLYLAVGVFAALK